MSDLDLDHAQSLADAATPGPWTATPPIDTTPFGNYWAVGTAADGLLERFTADVAAHLNAENDARFAAAARELVPALIERVRELEAGGFDPDKVEEQLRLESLTTTNGNIDVKLVSNGDDAECVMLAISDSMGLMLDTYEATNYVEFTVSKQGRPTFVTNIRRYGKPTPHELRQQAEAERDEWRTRAEAAELRNLDLEDLNAGSLALVRIQGEAISRAHALAESVDRDLRYEITAADVRAALEGES